MHRVLPPEYIIASEAFNEWVSRDSEWRQLREDWGTASGAEKAAANRELVRVQDELTQMIRDAVAAGDLSPIALQRTEDGRWPELKLPKDYYETNSGWLSLEKGVVHADQLSSTDSWIDGAVLCFRRSDLDRWMAGRTLPSDEAVPPAVPDEDAPVPERRTGRWPKWDWIGAGGAFAAYLGQNPDGFPQIQADAERWVADWFAKVNGGDSPPIQEIRLRVVAPAYKAARSKGLK